PHGAGVLGHRQPRRRAPTRPRVPRRRRHRHHRSACVGRASFAGRVAAVAAAALWAISPVAVSTALGGLETSLAILCAIALVALWMWTNDRPSTRRAVVVGVVAGLTVLARVDLVLLVALLVALQLCRGPRRLVVPGVVAGALVLAPWWLWCTLQFGTPVP